jgi:hypothetical protein
MKVITREKYHMESTTKTIEAQSMKYHPFKILEECKVLKLSTGALEFPLTEMQEKAQALCHIDLL